MAANQHAHHAPAPVGGSLFNAATLVCCVLIAIILFLQWRPAGLFAARSRSLED